MVITVQVEPHDGDKLGPAVPMELEVLGSQAYIRITLEGREYDLDYREFWSAARAVCLDAHDPQ